MIPPRVTRNCWWNKAMSMEFTFRRLTTQDLDMILSMNRDFREGFVKPSAARDFLENPSNWLWATVHGNAVIGFAYGYALQRLDGAGPMLYVHEVGIAEPWQHQGVGFRMMTALKDACRAAGMSKLFLSCYQSNAGANALYRKLGGEVGIVSHGNDTCYYFPL